MTKFFGRGAPKIVIVGDIFDNLALRISLIVKEVGECNPRRVVCCPPGLSLFLLVLTSSWLTIVGLTTGLQVSSNLVVVLVVPVFVFPFECTMKESTCCGWLGRIDGSNCSACR